MTTIIRYITGFPKDKELHSKKFDEVRKQYKLKKENVDVCEYRGSLTSADLTALEGVLTSEQYFRMNNSIKKPQVKRKFLNSIRESISGNPKLTSLYHKEQLKNLPETSENFLPALEELLDDKDKSLSFVDAQDYLLEQAKKSGLYVPISFSYPYKNIEDLAYNKRVLVFMNEDIKAEVTLRKTREYFDQFAGQTEEGVATIKIGNRMQNVNWNFWQSNFLRWIIDPKIRKEILKEKEEGMRFTRL